MTHMCLSSVEQLICTPPHPSSWMITLLRMEIIGRSVISMSASVTAVLIGLRAVVLFLRCSLIGLRAFVLILVTVWCLRIPHTANHLLNPTLLSFWGPEIGFLRFWVFLKAHSAFLKLQIYRIYTNSFIMGFAVCVSVTVCVKGLCVCVLSPGPHDPPLYTFCMSFLFITWFG